MGFWTFALIGIYLKETTEKPFLARTIVKMIPAFLAVAFIFFGGSSGFFYTVLILSLFLCGLGDIGMEYNILPGLGMFLLAHFAFTGDFLYHSIVLGISPMYLTVFALCFAVMMVYVVFYHRHLKTSSHTIPPSMLRAVDFYAVLISLTMSTSLLLWLTSGAVLGFVPFIGGCIFVASDSLVGIREFHHSFKHQWLLIMTTYYLAIFLLSLAGVLYAF